VTKNITDAFQKYIASGDISSLSGW
jgi:hypothetical protein